MIEFYHEQKHVFVTLAATSARAVQPPVFCVSLSDERTRERELKAADKAMEHLHLPLCTLITLEEEDIKLEHGTVHMKPAWRWFLE